jgi:hypothetical protein
LAPVKAQAATFTVTTIDDSGPGSLRQAISDANASPGDDNILFTTNGTIALASPLPLVTDNIAGAGGAVEKLKFEELKADKRLRDHGTTDHGGTGARVKSGKGKAEGKRRGKG